MIRRGEPWGHATVMPNDVFVARSDHAIATADPSRQLFPESGDIAHSLGNPRLPMVGSECTEVQIDAMLCTVVSNDGTKHTVAAASSLTIGSPMHARHVIVSNAGWLGDLNVAPRAHPNDGHVEMLTFAPDMTFRQRVIARRRMRTGTHLPHPDISMSRIDKAAIERIGREKLVIDGQEIPEWTSLSMHVRPDYWRVLV